MVEVTINLFSLLVNTCGAWLMFQAVWPKPLDLCTDINRRGMDKGYFAIKEL